MGGHWGGPPRIRVTTQDSSHNFRCRDADINLHSSDCYWVGVDHFHIKTLHIIFIERYVHYLFASEFQNASYTSPLESTCWGSPSPSQKKNLTCYASFHDLKELTMRIMSYADYKMTRHSPVSYDSLLGRKDQGGERTGLDPVVSEMFLFQTNPSKLVQNWGAVWKIGGISLNGRWFRKVVEMLCNNIMHSK